MLLTEARPSRSANRPLSITFARHADEVAAAQALRYRVFGEEMGARLSGPAGLDVDVFDNHCEHLLVRDDDTGEVVGTYRILPPAQARKLGTYYAETEFDLTRLHHIKPSMVEVGRSCVHPEYRNGATIAMLWSGLAQYMAHNGYDYLSGCASVSMADGGHYAASLYRQLFARHAAPIEWRVFPRCGLPLPALGNDQPVAVPPLIRGYLHAGCLLCGEPAWDPDFNTADLFVLLPMNRISPRYARHFRGG